MSKSRPFFLSSSSLWMIGTRNEPFDGGARPPAPDLFTCAQACSDRRMAGDRTTPIPKARTTVRRDHLRELIRLSFSPLIFQIQKPKRSDKPVLSTLNA